MKKENFEIIECAGGILKNEDNVALVKNIRAGFWGFPKGRIEKNEKPADAARREVFEETGIKDIRIVKSLGSYKRAAADGKPVLLNNHMFLFSTRQEKFMPLEGHALDTQWVPIDKVDSYLELDQDKKFFQSVILS